MKNTRLTIIFGVIITLLMIPLIAMQFTSEVDWSSSDFVIMGVLLSTVGLLLELILRTVKSRANRIVLCLTIFGAFFLIWAELAVGIFGTPFAGS